MLSAPLIPVLLTFLATFGYFGAMELGSFGRLELCRLCTADVLVFTCHFFVNNVTEQLHSASILGRSFCKLEMALHRWRSMQD